MEKQDIDKLELLADGLNDLVDVGENIAEDGKIDLNDIQYLGDMGKATMKVVKAMKEYREIGEEIKDIDPVEAVRIVQVLFAKK